MKTSEVLHKAAEYIATYGHYKGFYIEQTEVENMGDALEEGVNPPACAKGAICMVQGKDREEYSDPAIVAMRYSLDPNYPETTMDHVDPVVKLNDATTTTAEDVILKMKQVAAKLESEDK